MLSSKWHGHYYFTLDWNIQKLFIVLLPREEIHTESDLSDETWLVRLQLREIVCCIYKLEFVWLNGVKAVYGIPLRHMQETQCRANGVCVAAVPTNAHPPPALRLALGPCSRLCGRDHPLNIYFSPLRKHQKWINLFWVCHIYSSGCIFLIPYFKTCIFYCFCGGQKCSHLFSLFLMFYSMDTWNVIGP